MNADTSTLSNAQLSNKSAQTNNIDIAQLTTATLSTRLKQGTSSTHESLDKRIMRAEPFSNLERYADFLKVQYVFHWVSEPLYTNEALIKWIPNITTGCRLQQVIQDCHHAGISDQTLAKLSENVDKLAINDIRSLGWLYTIEGSNIGAAFLFKFAQKMGLDKHNGAMHLAANPEGRGRYWNQFKQHIDAINLPNEDVLEAQHGAQDAFAFVRNLVEEHLS